MYLIDDVDFEPTYLRGKAHLIYELTDVIDRVVGGGIQLKNIQAVVLIRTRMHFVNAPGQNPRARRFSNPPRPRKQKSLGEVSTRDLML